MSYLLQLYLTAAPRVYSPVHLPSQSSQPTIMNTSILLCLCLALSASAIPQLGDKAEAAMVSGLFTIFCGSATSRPTCTCPDASTFLHPYYIAYCGETSPSKEGEEPESCLCPNGQIFPATEEELMAMLPAALG